MILVDVNVLVYAHRVDMAEHAEYAAWMTAAAEGTEPFALSAATVAGFPRVVTHPRIFSSPTTSDVAVEFIDALAEARSVGGWSPRNGGGRSSPTCAGDPERAATSCPMRCWQPLPSSTAAGLPRPTVASPASPACTGFTRCVAADRRMRDCRIAFGSFVSLTAVAWRGGTEKDGDHAQVPDADRGRRDLLR